MGEGGMKKFLKAVLLILSKLEAASLVCLIKSMLKALIQKAIYLLDANSDAAPESEAEKCAGMREGIQTNFPNEVLRQFGCHFFVLMKWLEVKHGMRFSDDNLISIFETAAAAGFIRNDNAFVLNDAALINHALGFNAYMAILRDLREAPADGTAIRRLVRGTKGETHFTLQIEGIEWDTLDPARPAAKTWSFHSFRVPVTRQ